MSEHNIDASFLRYGVRSDDLEVIRRLSTEEGMDPDWLTEQILKVYHEREVEGKEPTDQEGRRLIGKAIKQLPNSSRNHENQADTDNEL